VVDGSVVLAQGALPPQVFQQVIGEGGSAIAAGFCAGIALVIISVVMFAVLWSERKERMPKIHGSDYMIHKIEFANIKSKEQWEKMKVLKAAEERRKLEAEALKVIEAKEPAPHWLGEKP